VPTCRALVPAAFSTMCLLSRNEADRAFERSARQGWPCWSPMGMYATHLPETAVGAGMIAVVGRVAAQWKPAIARAGRS
jgi:hypothetical protein